MITQICNTKEWSLEKAAAKTSQSNLNIYIYTYIYLYIYISIYIYIYISISISIYLYIYIYIYISQKRTSRFARVVYRRKSAYSAHWLSLKLSQNAKQMRNNALLLVFRVFVTDLRFNRLKIEMKIKITYFKVLLNE